MDIEKLIEDLRGLLKQYGEKIPYGELVGAPWPYSRAGDLVWQDPEPYFIEQAATALSTFQAENEKLRSEAEGMRSNWYKSVEEIQKLRAELEQVVQKYETAVKLQVKMTEISNRQMAELEQVKAERDAAIDCIYKIGDALDRGNDNDWAREHISEWESQKED